MSRPPLIRAARREWTPGVQLLIARRAGPYMEVATDLNWKVHQEGVLIDPTLELDTDDAQALIDQLWDCGLRPSEGSGSAGALAATQRHLEDFRRLVFDDPRTKP